MNIMHPQDAGACWPALIALADARRIYAQLFPVADIVGTAYGAAACDRALRTHTAVSTVSVLLGGDLQAVQRTLSAIEAECSQWQGVRRAVRAVLRSLLALCSHLQSAARREHADGFDAQQVTALYFGSDHP